MFTREFIQEGNINMLWEVISDEDSFKFLTRDVQAKVYQLFVNNIQGFFNVEKTKTYSLVDMNKKYILLILNHIKQHYNIQPNKITIHHEPIKESITFEEIQNNRLSRFEKDLNQRREDFDDAINVKPPPVPEFADKERDSPIKEMDKILKEMQSKRNYDIDQINKNHNNASQVDNWLKPKETSLKSDKFAQDTNSIDSQPHTRFKFLKTLEEDVSYEMKDKKNVSFSNIEDIQTFNADDDIHDNDNDDNIFFKLKKVKDSKKDKDTYENKDEDKEKPNIFMETVMEEDRIDKLEREVKQMNAKIDKLLQLLTSKH